MSEAEKKETIREWYGRTVKRALKAIVWATGASAVLMGAAWIALSHEALGRIQTFNGALTVPVAAGLWTASLVFCFLRPTREAAFRSQESMDRGIDTVKEQITLGMNDVNVRLDHLTQMFEGVLSKKVIPAIECWSRVGLRLEDELINQKVLDQAKSVMNEMGALARKLEKDSSEIQPTLAALRAVQEKLDRCFDDDFVDDMKLAVQGIRDISGVPSVKKNQSPQGVFSVPPRPSPEPAPAYEEAAPPPSHPMGDISFPVVIQKPKTSQGPLGVIARNQTDLVDFSHAAKILGKKKTKV